jgi:hypothetical protein
MTEKYSFFGSAEGDIRDYDQTDYAEVYKRFIKTGVFPSVENELVVAQTVPARLAVQVNTGEAFIEGYWYDNTSIKEIDLPATDAVNPRIDRIVLRLDVVNERKITAEYLQGTAAFAPVAPDLTRTDQIYEISLAQVRVNAGATSILNANITDERGNTSLGGWAVPPIISKQVLDVIKPFGIEDGKKAITEELSTSRTPITLPIISGFSSVDSGATANRWAKFATVEITSQYAATNALISIMGGSSSAASSVNAFALIKIRAKQQNPLGQIPIVSIDVLGNNSIDLNDIVGVVVENTTSKTKIEFYVRVNTTYEVYNWTPLHVRGENNLTIHNIPSYVSALPAGYQTVATLNKSFVEATKASHAHTANASAYIQGSTEVTDLDGSFNHSTMTFTAPETGTYLFTFAAIGNFILEYIGGIALNVNGVNKGFVTLGRTNEIFHSAPFYLNKGDTCRYYMSGNKSGNIDSIVIKIAKM